MNMKSVRKYNSNEREKIIFKTEDKRLASSAAEHVYIVFVRKLISCQYSLARRADENTRKYDERSRCFSKTTKNTPGTGEKTTANIIKLRNRVRGGRTVISARGLGNNNRTANLGTA